MTRRFPKQISTLAVLASAVFPTTPLAGQTTQRLTTQAGIIYQGQVGVNQSVTRVTTPATQIYLTPAAIKSQTPTKALEKPITYRFNEEIVKAPKKGAVDLVIKNFSVRNINETGMADVSLLDPKLGQIQFRAAITLVTPLVIRWEGIEYDFELSFVRPDLARKMVQGTIDASKPATALRAARFYKQAGLYSLGLEILLKLDQESASIKAEISSLLTRYNQELLTTAETLTSRGAYRTAKRTLTGLRTLKNTALSEDATKRKKAILELCQQAETGEDWLKDKFPAVDLSEPACLRLSKLLKQMPLPALNPSTIHHLTHRWAEPIQGLKLTGAQIEEAVKLAKETGLYFTSETPNNNTDLAHQFATSKLPRELLVSIIRYAPTQVDPHLLRGWHRIEYQHPRSKKMFHYYVSFPPNFDTSTPAPAIFTMHGMNTKAEVMRLYWGKTADTHGYIMISPEYIYGREYGLKYMEEEIDSVHGAIAHASRTLPIDSSRILLQGHSQGGHAAWEIGGVLADRLSGVIPIIGVSRRVDCLTNYQKTPLYIIDGSEDGAAPKMNRESMPHLAKYKIDAIYVEYTGRKHEAFYEEYPRVMQWARHYSRKRIAQVNLIALRRSDFRRRWIEIGETKTPLPDVNYFGKERATVTGKVHTAKITLKTQNVKTLILHIPLEWSMWKSLQVIVNGRSQRVTPTLDWSYLLKHVHLTGDRHILYMNRIQLAP